MVLPRRVVVAGGLLAVGAAGSSSRHALLSAFGARAEGAQDFLGGPPVSVISHGAVADGKTDCTAAVTSALAHLSARGGGTLRFPRGRYAVASASLGVGIAVPENVRVDMDGSALTVTGTSVTDCVFKVTGVANFTIENGVVIGNSRADRYNNGAFCNVVMAASAKAHMRGIYIRNVEMRNFRANYWLAVQNLNTTYEIQHVRIENVRAISRSGNNQGGGIGVLAHAIVVDGALGPVRDVIVDEAWVEARYIKGGVIFRGEVIDGAIRNAAIRNAGLSHGADDEGCYAIALYDSAATGLRNITIDKPVITNPRDCGIYAAGGTEIAIKDPAIAGQTSTATTSLPKGAIAINQVRGLTVSGGAFTDNAYDLYLIPPTTNEALRFLGCNTKGSSEASVVISGSGNARRGVYFEGGVYDGDREGLVALNRTASYVSDIQATGVTFIGRAGSGVNLGVFGEPCASTDIRFSACTFRGASQGLYAGKITGDVTVENCSTYGLGTTVYGVHIGGSTSVNIRGLALSDQASGYGLYSVDAQGSLEGVTFSNLAHSFDPSARALGLARPTFPGRAGQVVQNLDPDPAEYATWVCIGDSTWRGRGRIEA